MQGSLSILKLNDRNRLKQDTNLITDTFSLQQIKKRADFSINKSFLKPPYVLFYIFDIGDS